MTMQTIDVTSHPETPIDENFDTLAWGAVYGKDPRTTENLVWAYYGGRWAGITVNDGQLALTDNATNYVVVNKTTGAISVSTTSTNWNDTTNYSRVYKLTTVSNQVTNIEDHRAGPYGIHAGVTIPNPVIWNHQTNDYTLVIGDAENGIAMDKASAVTLTVPPNSAVPFQVGASILVAQDGAGQVTIAAGSGVTINVNTVYQLKLSAQYALATIVQRSTDVWYLSGDLQLA